MSLGKGFRGVVGVVFLWENQGKGEGGGGGQVNAQALSKLPFSKLPLSFTPILAHPVIMNGSCKRFHYREHSTGEIIHVT